MTNVDHPKRKQLVEQLEEMGADAIFFDGFEDAIIGLCNQQYKGPFVAYDRAKCIDILMKRDGMTHEEAEEMFGYNTEGCWAGEKTPFVFVDIEDATEIFICSACEIAKIGDTPNGENVGGECLNCAGGEIKRFVCHG